MTYIYTLNQCKDAFIVIRQKVFFFENILLVTYSKSCQLKRKREKYVTIMKMNSE